MPSLRCFYYQPGKKIQIWIAWQLDRYAINDNGNSLFYRLHRFNSTHFMYTSNDFSGNIIIRFSYRYAIIIHYYYHRILKMTKGFLFLLWPFHIRLTLKLKELLCVHHRFVYVTFLRKNRKAIRCVFKQKIKNYCMRALVYLCRKIHITLNMMWCDDWWVCNFVTGAGSEIVLLNIESMTVKWSLWYCSINYFNNKVVKCTYMSDECTWMYWNKLYQCCRRNANEIRNQFESVLFSLFWRCFWPLLFFLF